MRGLARDDTRVMTLGDWIDYCIEYNNLTHPGTGGAGETRKATQADMDRFKYG